MLGLRPLALLLGYHAQLVISSCFEPTLFLLVKLIEVVPSGTQGLEEVLIVLEGVHQEIPPAPSIAERINLLRRWQRTGRRVLPFVLKMLGSD